MDYAVFSGFFLTGANILVSQAVARLSGGAFSFIANKHWSFGRDSNATFVREGRRFLLLYAASYVLALVVVYFLAEIATLPAYPAKIATDTLCFIFNFMVMQRYVFSDVEGISSPLRVRIFKAVKDDPSTLK